MKVTMDYIFIWAFILSFHGATHIPLIQNDSYQRSRENTKNEKKGENERQHYGENERQN